MIYLDNASTTPLDPSVAEAVAAVQGLLSGNASSLHRAGVRAAAVVEKARAALAGAINAEPGEIIFTGSGTEANNLALKGLAFARRGRGDHIVTTRIEHASVLETARWLQAQGFSVTFVPVDGNGFVDPDDIRKSITAKTILVSVMHANNEIGTIEPVAEIGACCRARGVCFHTDACQSFTRVPLDVKQASLDLVSLNAHKIHGPRGVGALYVRRGIAIEPLLHGGGQEEGIRPGTYNTEGIAGFGRAVDIVDKATTGTMTALRDYCIETVFARLPGARLNGPRENRLCNNVNFLFPGTDGKNLFQQLSRRDIMTSAGAACHARKNTPSHVLLAIGLSAQEAQSSLRLTLSKWTTREDLDAAAGALADLVRGKGEPGA